MRPSSVRSGSGTSWATGRPRSVTVSTSPLAARATAAEAFCLRARMPISAMCSIVEHLPRRRLGTRGFSNETHQPHQRPGRAHLLRPGRLSTCGNVVGVPTLLVSRERLECFDEGPTAPVGSSASDLEAFHVGRNGDVGIRPNDLPRRLPADQLDLWCTHGRTVPTGCHTARVPLGRVKVG